MELIKQVLSEYGMQILGTILTGLATYLGIIAKKYADKLLDTKTKKDVAKTVVSAIEQCYKELSGPEKLQKALEAASEMLTEKGIKCTDVELRLLLESALAEFNKVFEKNKASGKKVKVTEAFE